VSSILEALRELESQQTPVTGGIAAPAEQPTAANRTVEVVGVVTIGLALGALGFFLFIALASLLHATASHEEPAPVADAEPRATARPSWLDTAEPPRAYLGRQTTEPRVAAARPKSEAPPPSSAAIDIDAIEYSPDTAQRAVRLRIDDTVVRLRERESARGLEVQSIQPNGVYVRRGGDVFMLSAH
jgi:hypothetical protein